MYGSGSGRQTDFANYSVYEVRPPAPARQCGWYWELKKTYESAGPYTYDDAVRRGRNRAAELEKDGA